MTKNTELTIYLGAGIDSLGSTFFKPGKNFTEIRMSSMGDMIKLEKLFFATGKNELTKKL